MGGKVAVVTGANRGIGRALALFLAKKGYSTINASKSEPENKDVQFIKTDIRKTEDCKNTMNKVAADFGRIDLLVNAAGVLFPDTVENLDQEKMAANFETNVFGSFYCSHYAINHMKKQGSGRVVNISSSSGLSFKDGQASYSASKWAVIGFSGALRLEMEKHGIDVICFCPGGTRTRLFRHSDIDTSGFMDASEVAENIYRAINREDREKWLFLYYRKDRKLKQLGFDDYPNLKKT